jgi:hypothetical protein
MALDKCQWTCSKGKCKSDSTVKVGDLWYCPKHAPIVEHHRQLANEGVFNK